MGKNEKRIHFDCGLKISAAVMAVALFVGSIVLAAHAAGQWSISYNGTRNNRLRFDGYLEIYSADDLIIYRKEFTNVNSVDFDDLPYLGGGFEDIRIEYGVKPHGTLLSPTDAPTTDYWIYSAGDFIIRLSASGATLPIFNISAVNYVRDDTILSFGAPPVETPAEYWAGFTVPLNKGIVNAAVLTGNAIAVTTIPVSTGYIDSLGARDIPKNPVVFSDGGYLVTALDVRQLYNANLTLSSVANDWTFRRGFYQGADPETTPPTTETIPVYTLPEYGTDVTEIWGGVFNNSFGDVFLVPVLITTLSIILGGFILFGRRE